jgi:hypothetical protein
MANWINAGSGDNMPDALEELFNQSVDTDFDDASEELEAPTLILNLDEINGAAHAQAVEITERLSNYYFDEKYLVEHPYVKNKIAQEIENIRRLLKMITVNEKAQDALITNITSNAGKGSLYQSLTSLQNTTLSIQAQLNKMINDVEDIFREMQADCEKTFEEKEKEVDMNVVRGSRDFISGLIAKGFSQNSKYKPGDQMDMFDNEEFNKGLGNA